jgi:hypothetical protein
VLAPVLPLFYHATDWDITRAARYFGAMKRSILGLETFYKTEADVPLKGGDPSPLLFPYPREYSSLSQTRSFVRSIMSSPSKITLWSFMDGQEAMSSVSSSLST